jgi:hypothetical protein
MILIAGLTTLAFIQSQTTSEDRVFDFALANAEALADEGGTSVDYCYLDLYSGGQSGSKIYCNSNTNSSTIYPCPSSSDGLYSELSKDRCTK